MRYENLQHAIDTAGFSQVELAQRLGVTGPAVNHWCHERDGRRPDLATAMKIVAILRERIPGLTAEAIWPEDAPAAVGE